MHLHPHFSFPLLFLPSQSLFSPPSFPQLLSCLLIVSFPWFLSLVYFPPVSPLSFSFLSSYPPNLISPFSFVSLSPFPSFPPYLLLSSCLPSCSSLLLTSSSTLISSPLVSSSLLSGLIFVSSSSPRLPASFFLLS